MSSAELELLLSHFQEEKEFIDGGYYRIREKGDNQYELAFLMPDSCGTTTVHPQITVVVEGNRIRPVSLIDFYQTPIRKLVYSKETAKELEIALTELVERFKSVKKLA